MRNYRRLRKALNGRGDLSPRRGYQLIVQYQIALKHTNNTIGTDQFIKDTRRARSLQYLETEIFCKSF